ncbi:MAG TPA: HDOD domain-containing protein [Opitutaceae bacterium]|nr:HDOD domain-containing protein [Opitutaceae bacterium]
MIATPISSDALLHVTKGIPGSLSLLAELGRMLSGLQIKTSGIVALLNRNPQLGERVLLLGNSPLYNTGARPYLTLQEVVADVGPAEIYRLVGLAMARLASAEPLATYTISANQLLENTLFTALLAEALVDTGKLDPRAAFTAGLLRSVGKIALDHLGKEHLQGGTHGRPDGLADWEMAYLGLTNCEAAAVVLRAWRFSPEIIAGVRDHYLIGAKPAGKLAHLVNVAASVTARCGFGLPGESDYFEASPEKYAAAHLTEAHINDAVVRTLYAFNQIRLAVGQS